MKKFLLFLAICVLASCQPAARTLGASGGTASPIIPASWTVAAWFVDPANVTGTASDSNDCQTSSTQCLTFQEIEVHRWGTYSPRLQQATTINVWSSQAGGSLDFLYIDPYMDGGGLTVKGNLGATQQIATGTIAVTGFVAKNRATPALLQANTGATAANQLIVNATHSSRAWTIASLGAGVFSITEPIAPITVPSFVQGGTSVDTWATGDTVTVFAPPLVHIGEIKPKIPSLAASSANLGLAIYQLNVAPPNSGSAGGQIVVNPFVSFVESEVETAGGQLLFEGTARQGEVPAQVNSILTDVAGGSQGSLFVIAGGRIDFSTYVGTVSMSNDLVFGLFAGSTGGIVGGNVQGVIGAVYIVSGATLTLTNGFRGDSAIGGNTAIVWGPGSLNLRGGSRLNYPAGAGAAAAAFLFTGTFSLNGQTKACTSMPGSVLTTLVCNITVSAANLDTNLGATSGCLSAGFGSGSICNFGP